MRLLWTPSCGEARRPADLAVRKVRFDAFDLARAVQRAARRSRAGRLRVADGTVRGDRCPAVVRVDFPVTLLADCCAAKTRRLHELSIEVLTSYELAEVARVSEGYDVGQALIRA